MADTDNYNTNQSSSEPSNPSFETERKTAHKFISGTAQTLIQWMPLGGSGGLLISFLSKQEWVMALLTFPVMIVTVFWAKYTDGFLSQLGEVAKRRGKEDVNALITFLKNLDEAVRWQLAGTNNKYLRCQGNACLHYTTEGVNRTFKPLLKDVFVPLDLSSDFFRGSEGQLLPIQPGFNWDRAILKRVEQKEGLIIWDILKRGKSNPAYRHLIIQAWGGYGKTTLLRHISYIYTQKYCQRQTPELIPVLLYLRKWQQVIATTENLKLPNLIEQHHLPSLPEGKGLKLPQNWAKHQLSNGKMLILFDGFDEVKEEWRSPVSQWIGKAMTDYYQSFFILTSRPSGYHSYVAEYQPNSLYVKPFNSHQQKRFIQRWYLSRERQISAEPDNPVVKQAAAQNAANLLQQLSESSELRDLAKNPLLLNIIVNLHSCYPSEQLPQRKTDLYREIFQLQLGNRPLARQIDMVLSANESQNILQEIALDMMQSNLSQIAAKPLLERLQTSIHAIDEQVEPATFLKQIEEISELLVRREQDYEFAHLSFQAYLAAKQIEALKQEQLLLENHDNSWWRETTLLYGAQVNPSHLIDQLCQINTPDAVDLAYACLQASPRTLDSNLVSLVQELRYQPLEKYLKNHQWYEADKETLRVMLRTVGKETDQWLSTKDIENFPCEDFRKIDQLWVKYSEGRFGFSVQKRIYLDTGNPLGEYNRVTFAMFREAVGWRKDGNRLRQIIHDTSAPNGHLPCVVCVVLKWDLRNLFSRAESCNL